jgi:hypothetical protein
MGLRRSPLTHGYEPTLRAPAGHTTMTAGRPANIATDQCRGRATPSRLAPGQRLAPLIQLWCAARFVAGRPHGAFFGVIALVAVT